MNEETAFFEQMATCRDAYRRLADCIHETIGSEQPTAFDLGCGLGAVGGRLVERGWAVVGLEVSAIARQMSKERLTILDLDLSIPPEDWRRSDVVICTETAEHIEPEHADAVVENIVVRARNRIVFSAAQPGQEWPGHVNLQPISYWLEKFRARGWEEAPLATWTLRERMRSSNAQHYTAADNFVILQKQVNK